LPIIAAGRADRAADTFDTWVVRPRN